MTISEKFAAKKCMNTLNVFYYRMTTIVNIHTKFNAV